MAEVDELDINYIDAARGTVRKTPVGYGNLSQFVRDKIDAVDLTVHELIELAIIEERIGNLHLMQISSEEATEKDIEWP